MRESKVSESKAPTWQRLAIRCLLATILGIPIFYLGREFGLSASTFSAHEIYYSGRGDIVLTGLYINILLIVAAIVAFIFQNRALFYLTAIALVVSAQIFEKPFPFRRFDHELAALRMLRILITVGISSCCLVFLFQFKKYQSWNRFSIMGILGLTTILAILLSIWSLIVG